MNRTISAAELERLRKRGAKVAEKPKLAPKPEPKPEAPKQVADTRIAGMAAKSAERAENAAILVADIARSISEMSIKQLSQIKQIVANVNEGREPVPWKVTVNRDNRGFIQDLDVIPSNIDEAV